MESCFLHQSSCTNKLHAFRSHLFNCLVKLAWISPPKNRFFPLSCWRKNNICVGLHHNSSWPWSLLRSWPMSREVAQVFSKFQVIWIFGPSAVQRHQRQKNPELPKSATIWTHLDLVNPSTEYTVYTKYIIHLNNIYIYILVIDTLDSSCWWQPG